MTRVTACLVMLNSYLELRNFQLAPNNHCEFFFLHTLPSAIAFNHLYALFYKYYSEISTFSINKCSDRHLPTTLTLKCFDENGIKTDVIVSKRHAYLTCHVMHERHLTHLSVRRHYLALVSCAEIPVGYARIEPFRIRIP